MESTETSHLPRPKTSATASAVNACLGVALGLTSIVSCGGGGGDRPAPSSRGAEREAARTPRPSATPPLTEAKVVREEVDDSPIKTQISSVVTIPLDTSKSDLDRYLQWFYATASSRTGFKHHATPNSVWAFVVYDDIDYENCQTCWVARVAKAAADDTPEFENKIPTEAEFDAAVKKTIGDVQVEDGVVTHSFAVDDGFLIDAKSSAAEITESLWGMMFIVAELAFPNFGRIEKIAVTATHKGKPVASLNLTRSAFQALKYFEWVERTGTAEEGLLRRFQAGELSEGKHAKLELRAKLDALRELLDALPKGSFEAKKGYLP